MTTTLRSLTWPTWESQTAALSAIIAEAEKAQSEGRFISATDHIKRFNQQLEVYKHAVAAIKEVEASMPVAEAELLRARGQHPELPAPGDTLEAVLKLVEQALKELSDEDEWDFYADTLQTATKASERCKLAVSVTQNLGRALAFRLQKLTRVQEIVKGGYKSTVDAVLADAEKHLKNALKSLTEGDYETADRWARELIADLTRAVDTMEARVVLHLDNEKRLSALSAGVAAAYGLLKTAEEHLEILKKGYHKGNWSVVENSCPQARKLVDQTFDNPADPDDNASKANDLNKFDGIQNFDACHALVIRMEADLASSLRLISGSEAQYTAVLDAENHHDAIMASANLVYADALNYRDQNNPRISAEVDELLAQAFSFGKQARQADDQKIYTDVVAFSLKVKETSERAKSLATQQVTEIKQAFDNLAEAKTSANRAYSSSEANITGASRVVVQSRTQSYLSQAQSLLQDAAGAEASAARFEDLALLSALERAIKAYGISEGASHNAAESLGSDRVSYADLLQSAQSEVSDARSAISSARSVCGDYRASSAGDSSLSSANSMCPSVPSSGETRSALQSIITQAQAAASRAANARSEAQDEIEAYERRKREEEERERRQREEEARRQREAEEAREREQRRQSEERMRSTTSNFGSTHSMGGGFGGTHSSGAHGF